MADEPLSETQSQAPQQKGISFKAIGLGFLVDIVGSFSAGFLAGFLIAVNYPGTNPTIVMQEPLIAGGLLFAGFLFTMLGGYVAGRIAKSKKLLNATWVGVIGALLLVITEIIPAIALDGTPALSVVLKVGFAVLTVLAAYVGGKFAAPDSSSEGVAQTSGVFSGKSVMFVALPILLAFAYVNAYFYVPNVSCTVETLYMRGELYTTAPIIAPEDADTPVSPETYSAGLVDIIDELEENKYVKAIFVDVDSPGGSPVAGEEIANALRGSSKTTVALIRSVGASAAYWAASGADYIIASANADVGGIGVSVNYLDKYQKNLTEGLNPNVISSAKYKSLGDPNLPLTEEQRAIIQRDVDEVHANFVKAVSENRELSLEDVELLADGATVLGSRALGSGLIDKLGDMNAVREYLQERLGEEPKICETYYQE